jgi:hypothetical protein
VQLRLANVEVVHADAMAREIIKKDPSKVLFCAILKNHDATSATTYTDQTPSDDIACLTPDEAPEYTNKTRALLPKHKSSCKSLEALSRDAPWSQS